MSKFEILSVLETELTDKEGCKKAFSVKVSKENLKKALDNKTQEIAKIASLPGFRPGKAPISMVKSHHAKTINLALMDEIVQAALTEKLPGLIKERAKLTDVLSFDYSEVEKLNLDPENDLTFTVNFELLPDIKLPEYTSLTVDIKKESVSNEEVEKEIERLKTEYGKYQDALAEEPAAEDDMLEIDISSDLEMPENPSPEVKRIINSQGVFIWLKDKNELIPKLNETLLGKKIGETAKLNIEFPADFRISELANKKAVYEIKINKIKKFSPISGIEELSKRFNFTDSNELKKRIFELIEDTKKHKYENECKENIIEQILKNTQDFELPNSLKSRFILEDLRWYVRNAVKNETDKEEFEKNKDEHVKKVEASAIKRLKTYLILRKIAEKENIKISDTEFEQKKEQICSQNDITPKDFEKSGMEFKTYIYDLLMTEKALDLLFEKNVKSSEKKKEEKNEDK